MDTRQWCSFGIVDADEGSSHALEYTTDYGPLVNVTLQPSGIPVRARVSSMCAGQGEADGEPFAEGDEVILLIPEGDEHSGCVIVGRLNNKLSPYPNTVAGSDLANNASFKRRLGPILYESNTAIIFRVAATESYLSLAQDGNATLVSGDQSYLHLGADFLGLQTGDANMVLQANQNTKEWRIDSQDGTHSTFVRFGGSSPGIMSSQGFFFGTAGQAPWQHLVTFEQMVAFVAMVVGAIPGGTSLPLTPQVVAATYILPLMASGLMPLVSLNPGLSSAILAGLASTNNTQSSSSGSTGFATNITAS